MDRRGYVLELLKVRPRSAGEVAFCIVATVKEAEQELTWLQEDADTPALVCENGMWRLDLTKVKAQPAPEPKKPARRRVSP